jgi:hypothetical protein
VAEKETAVVSQVAEEAEQELFFAPCCIHFKTIPLFAKLNSAAGAGGIRSSPVSIRHLYKSLDDGELTFTSRMMFV